MRKLREILWMREFQGFLFIACLMLFIWPFIARGTLGSLGRLTAYYFVAWFVVVCFLAFVSAFKEKDGGEGGDGEE